MTPDQLSAAFYFGLNTLFAGYFQYFTRKIRDAASEFQNGGDYPVPANEIAPLDGHFFFSAETARQVAYSMGDAGRKVYTRWFTTGDTFYPVVYTLMFSTMLLIQKKPQWITLIPMACDYIENYGIYQIMTRFPEGLEWAEVTRWANAVKWVGIAGVMLWILVDIKLLFQSDKPKTQ